MAGSRTALERDGTIRPGRVWCGWMKLGVGLLIIWCLVFVIAPWLQGWTPVGKVHASIDEQGIDAAALFYTEVDQFRDAELAVRHAMTYGPQTIPVAPQESSGSDGGAAGAHGNLPRGSTDRAPSTEAAP